jgi:hypothetical protein
MESPRSLCHSKAEVVAGVSVALEVFEPRTNAGQHRFGVGANTVSKTKSLLMIMLAAAPAALGGLALAAQDRYTLQVPGGLAFSEFRGYEDWQVVAVSHNGDKLATILGNPVLIEAYKAGIPKNGKPVPDGARIAKIHWTEKKDESQPGDPIVPGPLHDVDFMVKDSKRFADSGGWGWAAFEYDAASDSFRAADTSDSPPQEHDAKCGFACHTIVAAKDYVFTAYPNR